MKNLKLLALAFVIGSSSLFAASTELPDVPVKQISIQISELFTAAPDFTVSEDMKINVVFTFNSDGEVIVLKVDSKDKDVLNYIRKTLNHKMIDTPGEMNRVFTMPLTINKL